MPELACPHCGQPHPAGSGFCPATGRPLGAAAPARGDVMQDVVGLLKRAFELYRVHGRTLLLTCALLFVPASLAKSLALAWIEAPLVDVAGSVMTETAGDVERLSRAESDLRDALAHKADPATLGQLRQAQENASAALARHGLHAATSAVSGFGRLCLGLLATFVTSFLLYGVILPLTQGALTVAVADRLRGGDARPREIWMLLLRRLGTLLPTVLLSGVLVAVGFLFFVIPGLVLAFLFAFVSPVVLIERRSGFEALKRSRDLVRGDWLRVALVLVAFGIVRWFAQMLASLIVPLGAPFVGSLLGDLVTLVLMPVPVLGLVLVYDDIRRRREGTYDDSLAAELAALKNA